MEVQREETLTDCGLYREKWKLKKWLQSGENRAEGKKRGKREGGPLPLKASILFSTHIGL